MSKDKAVTTKKEAAKVVAQDDDMLVWAFKPLSELKNETGFVTCKESLGNKLIKEGKVQHPDEGALNFKEIETGEAPVQPNSNKEVKKEQKKVIEPPNEETK